MNPGSPEAKQQGCLCPVQHGPYLGQSGIFIIVRWCPLHGISDPIDIEPPKQPAEIPSQQDEPATTTRTP